MKKAFPSEASRIKKNFVTDNIKFSVTLPSSTL